MPQHHIGQAGVALPLEHPALAYVPAGIALGWTYEKSNTIWGPILLHMAINAISFGIMSLM